MSGLALVGQFAATVDSKHRVFLPTELQRILEVSTELALYVGKPYRTRCVSLLTKKAYDEMLQFVSNRSEYHPLDEGERAHYVRHCLATYRPEKISQGRIHIDDLLLQSASLEPRDGGKGEGGTRCVIVGCFDRLEIWDPELLAEDARTPGREPEFRVIAAHQQVLTKSRSGWSDPDADVAS